MEAAAKSRVRCGVETAAESRTKSRTRHGMEATAESRTKSGSEWDEGKAATESAMKKGPAKAATHNNGRVIRIIVVVVIRSRVSNFRNRHIDWLSHRRG